MKYIILAMLLLVGCSTNVANKDEDKYKKKAVIVKLNEANFEAKTKTGVVVVDFYADWCGPCRMLSPVLEELTEVTVGKVDIETEQNLAVEYNVSSIPLLVFMKDGKEESRMVGLQTKEKIQKVIDGLKEDKEDKED